MSQSSGEMHRLAEAIRAAFIRTALDAYQDAGLRGLCAEGRWECAVDAVRDLDLAPLIRSVRRESLSHSASSAAGEKQ